MSDLQRFLPQPGAEVFDPESLTREVLHQRLLQWIRRDYFSVWELNELLALIRDLAGQPAPACTALSEVPHAIGRLNSIRHDTLSPINRREAFRQVLAYLGLSGAAGPELLGSERWEQMLGVIEARCGGAPAADVAQRAAPQPPHEWTRRVMATQLVALMDHDFFSICDFDRLNEALQKLREQSSLPPHDVRALTPYTALQALHCVRYKAMDRSVRQELPATVLHVLGLDESTGTALLGEPAWDMVRTRYARGPGKRRLLESIAHASAAAGRRSARWLRSQLATAKRD